LDIAMPTDTSHSLPTLASRALGDLGRVFERLPTDAADAFVDAIARAGRIAIYGAGREGSLFETAQMVLFELVVLALRDRLGETSESMRKRHTNLE
jgi:D-arabinose 5-phosphate isomerase GutQ